MYSYFSFVLALLFSASTAYFRFGKSVKFSYLSLDGKRDIRVVRNIVKCTTSVEKSMQETSLAKTLTQ